MGDSIHDSENRWMSIHGTDYLVIRDCVGFNCIGHGYFLEDDDRSLQRLRPQSRRPSPPRRTAFRSRVPPFDHNKGEGFWWSNAFNTFTRNVAADATSTASASKRRRPTTSTHRSMSPSPMAN